MKTFNSPRRGTLASLLARSLLHLKYLPRGDFSHGLERVAGAGLLSGTPTQSRVFSVHVGVARLCKSSPGQNNARASAPLIQALLTLAGWLIQTACPDPNRTDRRVDD